DALVKSIAQFIGAERDQRASQAGNIETLGRRIEGYCAGGDVRPQRSKGNVLVPGKDQVGMDLVGDDDEIVLDVKLSQSEQLVAGKHPPGRILRIAQDEDAGALVHQL